MTTIAQLTKARIAPAWFHRDAAVVARELIGTALVHGKKAGLVVETEAYTGPDDLASHARFGKPGQGTSRTSVMWGPGGIAYVYLCYGIHEMFNVVTGPAGSGQAVLIRAIAPLVGLPDDPSVGRGPGKVTVALDLDRTHDRRDLAKGALFFAHVDQPAPLIAVGPRVGVDYAGASAALPLRFMWRGNASVSRS
ncbi:MAG TPA: DNA-3-methyladenine glycosylase [Kofleriaceae bacterium]|jgi:DNA-3-methyladenine glycosylase